TGTTRSSADLDPRRRKILFRSWHRGTREMDLIMGRYADAYIGELTEAELDDWERLIEVPDRDLFAWVTDKAVTPANYDTAVFRSLKT
ncbi:succinate dehydrogenase assembly factor 2, partial [Klebsiella aerogenes]|uniref:FAD assembly factor SdhE n=1 Tax=Klebsiella aerogenes TaxID=548 RepID=UPI0013D4F256